MDNGTQLLSVFMDERTMANIIVQRDTMILQLSQALQQAHKEIEDLKKNKVEDE